MTGKQEAKLSMYNAVINHCNANATLIATVPAFQAAFTAFSAKVASLTEAAQAEITEISGVAIDKAVIRKNLSQQAADISAALFAFASSTGNSILKEQARNPVSKFLNLRDELLTPACQNIHDLANANIAALNIYGITAATLTSFQTAITNYSDKVPAPRNAAAQRKTYTATIKTFFNEADAIVKEQMDNIVPQFKTTDPLFYITYKNNRIILDAGTSSTQAAGTVFSAVGNNPLSGTLVTVDGHPFSAVTAADGTFKLKIPLSGDFNLIFSKQGYITLQKSNTKVTLGQTTHLNVQLSPISV